MAEFLVGPQAKEWASRPSVVRWRERLAPGTFKSYYGFLVGFGKQVHKDPEELVAWTKASSDKYDVLDAAQKFILGLNGQRYATKHIAYAAIRSFLMHNRLELPRDCQRVFFFNQLFCPENPHEEYSHLGSERSGRLCQICG